MEVLEAVYWVYDGHDTNSYTKIHWSDGPELPACYRGGPRDDWHGPFATKPETERKVNALNRIRSGECCRCITQMPFRSL